MIGLITGLMTGATSIFTIPAVPYIQSSDLEMALRGLFWADGL